MTVSQTRPPARITTAAGVLTTLLAAAFAAAVLGSGPLLDWADDAADRTGIAGLHDAAEAWHSTLLSLGLTKPYTTVREKVRAAEQAPFERQVGPPAHD